ncbi:hypothetical protein DFP73DRAFT_622319 [Morchella snyderi]|nr:hypothetical protein DFP73DRAFT_622319 [Morchella snyderi]
MDNDNQAAIDLYAPIALEHTRNQYSQAKIILEQQHLQLADLQEQLINQQAEKIEKQLLLIREKDATIIELQEEAEKVQSQLLLIREKDATIAELRDELKKVRNVLASIADITTPIRSKMPQESRPSEGSHSGKGGDIAQQDVTTQIISRPTTMLRIDKELPAMPPMEHHTIANRPDAKPKEQPLPHKVTSSTVGEPLSSLINSQYGSRNSNTYTSPRSLSTISLPYQVTQSHLQPARESTQMSPSTRHPRYSSPLGIVREISPPPSPTILSARQGNLPPMGRIGSSSWEGLRPSMLSPTLPKPTNESLIVKAISLDKAEKFRGPKEVTDSEDENAMRKKIRSVAEKRKEAAFSQRDKIERDSTILTYITTTKEGPMTSNKSSTVINRLGSTSERIGKRLTDSKKKKPGIQKSTITHPSLNLPSEMPREVRSKFSESSDTETKNGADFGRITGLVDLQVSPEDLRLNGDSSGGSRRYREGKASKVMDKIRGWKEKDKG